MAAQYRRAVIAQRYDGRALRVRPNSQNAILIENVPAFSIAVPLWEDAGAACDQRVAAKLTQSRGSSLMFG